MALVVISSGTNESGTLDSKGSGTFGISTVNNSAGLVTVGNRTNLCGLAVNGSALLVNGTGGVGYGTGNGVGGTVTQITGRTTGVTLSKLSGAITLVSAAAMTPSETAAGSAVSST